MAPVAQIIVATLLAVSEIANAKPVGGAHRAPAVYNLGLGKRMKRGLRNLADRYYGDSQGLVSLASNNSCPLYTYLPDRLDHQFFKRDELQPYLPDGALWDV